MVEFKDIKAGDLIISHRSGGGIHSEAIVIGLPTEVTHSGGYLGLNPSTIAPGIMCYRKFPEHDLGYFLTLNESQWERGAKVDYIPKEQNQETAMRLLQNARNDLTQPLYKGKSLADLGLNSKNAKEVLNTIESLL